MKQNLLTFADLTICFLVYVIITLLNHLVGPSISLEVMSQAVNKGSNAFFSCQANGEPVPTISWYFNGTVLEQADTTKYIITNNTLDIVNVESSDVGTYTCNATNVVSSNTSSGVLTVNGEFNICSVLIKLLLTRYVPATGQHMPGFLKLLLFHIGIRMCVCFRPEGINNQWYYML